MSEPSYSSHLLRERDKLLEAKHANELSAFESRLAKLKYRNDDLLKQLYDARHRGDTLAVSLGFKDIYDAQVAIDGAEHETQYRQCVQRMMDAEAQLKIVKAENELLQGVAKEAMDRSEEVESLRRQNSDLLSDAIRLTEVLRKKDHDTKALQSALDGARAEILDLQRKAAHSGNSDSEHPRSSKSGELVHLQARYDHLAALYKKSAERALKDWNSYKQLRHWLFVEDGLLDYNKSSDPIFKEHVRSMLAKKLKKILEGGPDKFPLPKEPTLLDPHILVDVNLSNATVASAKEGKENCSSPVQTSRKRKEPLKTSLLSERNLTVLVSKTNNVATEQFQEPRVPAEIAGSDLIVPAQPNLKVPGSSDTEEDSQGADPLISSPSTPLFKVPLPPTSSAVADHRSAGSSDTEEDSQMPSSPSLVVAPAHLGSTPAWTASPRFFTPMSRERSFRRNETSLCSDAADATPRPTKVRRIGDKVPPSSNDVSAFSSTKHSKGTASLVQSRKNIIELLTGSRKGKETGGISTPSAIKSRAQGVVVSAPPGIRLKTAPVTGPSKSANIGRALFAINPDRNDGLDFQFHDVVRSKDDRRKLDAGDCECCWQYYEAIGPLPQGPSAPLWRSPPVTPMKPCTRHAHSHTSENRAAGKSVDRGSERVGSQAHKQAISRHRHQWARAGTPPGYWDIGFPSTQEAIAINDQAEVMHRKKEETMEAEAQREGGRYMKLSRD